MQTLGEDGAAWWINELGVQLVCAGNDVEHTTTKSRMDQMFGKPQSLIDADNAWSPPKVH